MSRSRRPVSLLSLLFLSTLAALAAGGGAAPAGAARPTTQATERVSLTAAGGQAAGASHAPSLSADGRYGAFESSAANLVPGDTNGVSDIFVRDRVASTTQRVSVGSGGVEANGISREAAISADGRWVAFASAATNLVAGDTNGRSDVFVYDRQTSNIERVSVATAGIEGNADSELPSISGDGRFVTFLSVANNLVPRDTNNEADIFVRDRQAGTTARVSVSSSGTQADGGSFDPRISSDGSTVVFDSLATNLVPGDTGGFSDIFVYRLAAGTTVRASVATDGTPGNGDSYTPAISSDGRTVVFQTAANNLGPGDTGTNVDIYVRALAPGTTVRASLAADGVTEGDAGAYEAAISGDGHVVAFKGGSTNLVPGDTNGQADIFVRDLRTGALERDSLSTAGAQADGDNTLPALSDDGRLVVFESSATNLVPGDTNGASDIFLRDRGSVAPPATITVTATATALPTGTATRIATATTTVSPTATPTLCAVRFSDVPASAYFYTPVTDLACRSIISGYSDATFRPYSPTTRAQMVKIVVLGFGLPSQTLAIPTFADVPVDNVFYPAVETAAGRAIVSGYTCGGVNPQTGAAEPCDAGRRPYFRPNVSVTRGQLAKIIVTTAGWTLIQPATGSFSDVAVGSTFYAAIETVACHAIVSGYSCGGAGEPCDSGSRPYFRPAANAVRGQIAKIVYGAIRSPAACAPPTAPR